MLAGPGRATAPSIRPNHKVAEVMERRVSTVGLNAPASELPRIFERGEVALVTNADRHVLGIITKMDLIEVLAHRRAAKV